VYSELSNIQTKKTEIVDKESDSEDEEEKEL